MPTIQKTKRIFEFIKGRIEADGKPPTIKEIGAAFGLSSTASVHRHLKKMESLGLIKRIPNVSRGIEIIKEEKVEAA